MKFLTAIAVFSSLINRATSEGCEDDHVNSINIPNADGAFHYTISDGVINVCLEANDHDGWLAVGFSTDGMMLSTTDGVNHTAAIGGLPLADMPSVVKLDLQQKAGYQPFSIQQTLSNVSYEVDEMGARLQFTKPIVEDGEVAITEDGENYFLYAWGAVGGPHTTYGHLKTSDFLANDKGEEPPIANDEVATNDEVVAEPETNDEVDLVPSTLADDNSAAVNNEAVLATTMMMVFGITLLL